MMDAADRTLENIVRNWAATVGKSVARVVTLPATRHGPGSFQVEPTNPRAASILLWVADDGSTVSFSIAGGCWWDGALPLKQDAVEHVLEDIAAGYMQEQVRKLFGRVVARRGTLGATDHAFTYGQINPFSVMPWLRWETVAYEPYAP